MKNPEIFRKIAARVRQRRSRQVSQPTQTPLAETQHTAEYIERKYLVSLKDLYKVSLADLGELRVGEYQGKAEEMDAFAKANGIEKPRMVVDIALKEANYFGLTEFPYAVADFEWDDFARDGKTIAKHVPHVHVVDWKKYVTGI